MTTTAPTIPDTELRVDVVEVSADERQAKLEETRRLAKRYDCEFVDMEAFQIDLELFRSIPADLMLRYGFVPSHREGATLVIVVSDPTNLPMLDESYLAPKLSRPDGLPSSSGAPVPLALASPTGRAPTI